MQRRNHGHLGRIPRDHTAPTRRQFREADLKALDELAAEAELDGAGTGERAVGLVARDEDRVDVSVSVSANPGDSEPLLTAELSLDPRRASAPGEVGRN